MGQRLFLDVGDRMLGVFVVSHPFWFTVDACVFDRARCAFLFESKTDHNKTFHFVFTRHEIRQFGTIV